MMADADVSQHPHIAVIKIGSSTVTTEAGEPDMPYLADLAHQVWEARKHGWKIVIVSSGSIPCGLRALGLPVQRPDDMPTVQAAASVGQRALISAYDQAFTPYRILTSLVLLTRRDTADRHAYLHARDTFRRLIDLDVVPIVNENDTVSVEQIRFGDNDTLAALVACLVRADRVVLFSDIEGLYTANPQTHPDAKLIPRVDRITHEIMQAASGPASRVGSGGMVTKLTSARVLGAAGIPMVICSGSAENALLRSLDDEPIGTLFTAREHHHEITPRKLWIALADTPKGSVSIDAGAEAALEDKGSSLLGVGITHVEGDFRKGDIVDVVSAKDRHVVARGVVRMPADRVTKDAGTVIHRDELIVF